MKKRIDKIIFELSEMALIELKANPTAPKTHWCCGEINNIVLTLLKIRSQYESKDNSTNSDSRD